MNEYVLFSPLGDTDPIRDFRDGSMLHIVRHYKPSKVYLIYTSAMEELDKATNCYEIAIKYIHPECEVIKKFTGIENAADFDAFYELFTKYLQEIESENKDAKILVNLSSGTPQMKTTASLEIVTFNTMLYPIQVLSPQRGSNRNSDHFNPQKDDIMDGLENNFDNDPNEQNRCDVPDLISVRRSMLKAEIKSLVESWEYKAAFEKVKSNMGLFSKELFVLVKHAYLRNIQHKDAKQVLKQHKSLENKLYQIEKPFELAECLEFYNITKLWCQKEMATDFVLRISALTERIAKKELNLGKRDRTPAYLIIEKLKEKNISGYDKLFGFLDIRNDVVHQGASVTEEDLKKLHLNSKQLLSDLKNCIKRAYESKEIKDSAFDIYGVINTLIIEELNK